MTAKQDNHVPGQRKSVRLFSEFRAHLEEVVKTRFKNLISLAAVSK